MARITNAIKNSIPLLPMREERKACFMNKKAFSLLIFIVILTFALCGCGANSGGASEENEFPDLLSFTAQTLDGGEYTARDFAGADLTMINIWGTYCGPCLREMPELAQLAKSLPENVRMITYCIDAADPTATAQEILDDAGDRKSTSELQSRI